MHKKHAREISGPIAFRLIQGVYNEIVYGFHWFQKRKTKQNWRETIGCDLEE